MFTVTEGKIRVFGSRSLCPIDKGRPGDRKRRVIGVQVRCRQRPLRGPPFLLHAPFETLHSTWFFFLSKFIRLVSSAWHSP